MEPSVTPVLVQAMSIVKPALSLIIPLAILPLLLTLGYRITKQFMYAAGYDDYPSTGAKKSKPEPEEDIYFDVRKDGYWVKSADGSKTFVSKDELYPNDVDRIDLTKKG
ncbi:hypothetical protein [Paenibacillus sp. FSL R7-0128]|uniref:hypothetical protein n=1 Tax=Paenibacillus sp. FSL R7-0128 TaxID=2954529 RepID=UPI0030F6BE71